jgi:surfeit locus 1 family protein
MTRSNKADGVWSRVRPVQATIVLIAFLILCGLGVWQSYRLVWKTHLLAQIAALQTAPPEPLNVVLNRLQGGGEVNYVRVQARCPGLQQTPTLRLYSVVDGQMGDRLITACPIAYGPFRSLLVDRGFVDLDHVGQVKSGPVLGTPVTGVLRRPDKPSWMMLPNKPAANDWHSRDILAMAAALNAPSPAPLFLMLEKPAPQGFFGPTPSPVPTDIPNNHLGYAITWFGLAVALAGVWIASLRRPRSR